MKNNLIGVLHFSQTPSFLGGKCVLKIFFAVINVLLDLL